MIITSLSLENIRSYISQKITFQEGINVLFGNIGSGKSTLLLAIEVALFGLKKGEGNHILRKGEQNGSITLILKNDLNDNIIEISRSFKTTLSGVTQSSGYIKINNNLEELSTQELNMHIFKYFNFPLSFVSKDKTLMYRFTHYTPQEQLKHILTTQSDKRLELLRKIFNIDHYKQLQHALNLTQKEYSKELLVLDTKLLELPKQLEDEIKLIQEEIKKQIEEEKIYREKEKEIQKKLEINSKNITQLISKQESIKQESILQVKLSKELIEIKEKITKDNKENENSSKELSLLKNTLEILQQKIKELKLQKEKFSKSIIKKEEIQQELYSIQNNILKYQKHQLEIEKYELFQKEIKEINSQKTLLTCRKKDIELVLVKLEKNEKKKEKKLQEKEDIEKLITTYSHNNLELNMKITNLDESIKKSKELEKKSICPTCKQKVDSKHISNEINNLEKERIIHTKEFKKNEAELKLQEKELKLLQKELQQHENNQKELIQKKEQLNEVELQLKNVNEKLSSKENKENIIHTSKEILKSLQELKIKKESLEKELQQLQKEVIQVKELENDLELKQKEINIISKNKLKFEMKIVSLEDEIKKNKEHIKYLEKELEKYKDLTILQEKISIKLLDQKEIEMKLQHKKEEIISKNSTIISQKKHLDLKESDLKKLLHKKDSLEKEKNIITSDKTFLQDEMMKLCSILEETVLIEVHTDLSLRIHHYFIQLIDDQDLDVYLREDFSLIIEQNGYEVEVEQLSGGEKSALALSYRLALKEVIEKHLNHTTALQYIMLDEPTDGFSQEQIQKFAHILKSSHFKQIFLVSHDSNLLTSAEYVYTVEKENHISKISN